VDLLSLYRDILMLQLGTQVDLVNEDLLPRMQSIAKASHPEQTLFKLQQIETARSRISANVNTLLVLEALAVNLRTKK
jgi:DNA polymerase-3 subunit delta'